MKKSFLHPHLAVSLFLILIPALLLLQPCPALGQSYNLYFNDPHDAAHEYDIEDEFISRINSASSTIDLCTFNINRQEIVDALVDWHNGGSQTARVVTDLQPGDSNYTTYIQQLIDDGISVTSDPSGTLSHNKFAVFDSTTVWTGSWNHTGSASSVQWNNAIAIDNAGLVTGYETEFDQMFAGDFHGSKVQVDGFFALGGGPSNDHYRISPQNAGTTTQQLITDEIDATVSGDTIYFAIYAFTDSSVSQALMDAYDRGVTIRGIFDEGDAQGADSEYDELLAHGLDVFFLADDPGNPFNPYIHHKYMIINPAGPSADPVVITGSANWSAAALVNASGNDENTLIIHDGGVASAYYANWNDMAGAASVPEPSTIVLFIFGGGSAAAFFRFRHASRKQ